MRELAKMTNSISRRNFLGKLICGIALLAGGGSIKTGCSMGGSEKGSLRLVFYTDVHARTEWDTPTAMALAANAINAQKPDLVIAGGDLITEGFQSSAATVAPRWDAYMKMNQAIKADVYPAMGNHDLVAAIPADGTPAAEYPRTVYLDRMGLEQTYYSFSAAGYHFIILDSIQVTGDEFKYQGIIGSRQLDWLKQDLSTVSKETPIVLVTHIPLLSSFFSASKGATYAARPNRVIVNNREVLQTLENHNLILVLQGHLHVSEMIKWQNTTFITGGAVCGKWWRGVWYGTEEGFYDISLTGNQVECFYIDYGWVAKRPVNQ
jgi:3',5'-cyclic AMP phosphodiesterase CpdA